MTSRRKYSNGTAAQIIKKIATPLPCEKCADLKFVPDFASSIMTVHKLTANQVPSWYHQRAHSVFPK